MALEIIPDMTMNHLRLLHGQPLAIRVPVLLAPYEVRAHNVVPQRAAAVVPVEFGVVDVVVDGGFLVPVAKSPMPLQGENDQPDAESTKHPQRSEHGHDGSCNLVSNLDGNKVGRMCIDFCHPKKSKWPTQTNASKGQKMGRD